MLTRPPSIAEGRLLPKDGPECSLGPSIRQGETPPHEGLVHIDMSIRLLSCNFAFYTIPAEGIGYSPGRVTSSRTASPYNNAQQAGVDAQVSNGLRTMLTTGVFMRFRMLAAAAL